MRPPIGVVFTTRAAIPGIAQATDRRHLKDVTALLLLSIRRDHLVFSSDEVPAWLCSPRWLGNRTTERLDTPRDLGVGHERSHIWTHVRGEGAREPRVDLKHSCHRAR